MKSIIKGEERKKRAEHSLRSLLKERVPVHLSMIDRAILILAIVTLAGLLSLALAHLALAEGSGGVVSGSFEVVVLPGDANGDGVINALDITKVERIILELDPETPGADANCDGNINAQDITKIELIILGL